MTQPSLERDQGIADLHSLLASMHVPAVFLHNNGRIAQFTPAARDIFPLHATDIGRPIGEIAARFQPDDLLGRMREVLQTSLPYEAHIHQVDSGSWWIMRVQPLPNRTHGAVVTFADITELKRTEAEREQLLAVVRHARHFAEAIVETVREPLLVLTTDLQVQRANQAFYTTFDALPAATEQQALYALGGGRWDVPALRMPLDALRSGGVPFDDVEVAVRLPASGAKTMRLHGRQILQAPGQEPLILLAIEDITDRREAARALQQAHDALEGRVHERTAELEQVNAALEAEIAERTRTEQARQLLLHQLVTAQEEERRRIARELHDQLGQDVTALLLGLKVLQDVAGDAPQLQHSVAQVQALAGQIGRSARTLAVQLRPSALDHLGLQATLAHYIEQWSVQALVAVDFHSTGLEDARLPLAVEITVYRLVQEALTNVLRHAEARGVSVIIHRRADSVQMIVEDDGVGFDTARSQPSRAERRLGLVGMQERVFQLGGTLQIESAPGSGTSLFVHIPLTVEASF